MLCIRNVPCCLAYTPSCGMHGFVREEAEATPPPLPPASGETVTVGSVLIFNREQVRVVVGPEGGHLTSNSEFTPAEPAQRRTVLSSRCTTPTRRNIARTILHPSPPQKWSLTPGRRSSSLQTTGHAKKRSTHTSTPVPPKLSKSPGTASLRTPSG